MDITRRKHKGNKYSIAAFQSTPGQKRVKAEMLIRELMISIGPKMGVTSSEASIELGMPSQTCSPRFSDMKRKGELHQVGERPTPRGKMAGAWTLVRLLPKS